jgi:trimeric autotransporter adhesin
MADFNNGLAVNGPLTISDEATTNIHFGAIVKAVIDDCSRHTDGGAWRKRCSDKSWFTEALGGEVWIGQQASIAAAWSAANSLPGAVFQATTTAGPLTSGKFYVATSATAATEVFRGISRDYPDTLLWVAETARVVGYDLTKPGCPMWMVFSSNSALANNAVRSIAFVNGSLWSATAANATRVDFVRDTTERYTDINFWFGVNNVSGRNSPVFSQQRTGTYLPNVSCNDVAITVLDTAPTDPSTGLPVPTIAVATAGGVSVIKNDGTVVNSFLTASANTIAISDTGTLFYGISGVVNYGVNLTNIAGGFNGSYIFATTIPPLANFGLATVAIPKSRSAHAAATGLSLLALNPATLVKSMSANITNAYNSGWMPGDIRGAYLADTTAETITASGELVTNGTFTTDTSGWTATNATLAMVGGELQITTNGLNATASQTITGLVVGKTYYRTLVGRRGTCTGSLIYNGTTFNATTSNVIVNDNFVASSTSLTISLTVGGTETGTTAIFDNISVKLADADRSVKNTGLVINGTLTKTAVASGAGLVAYTGMNTSNYLEQPFSTNLDFGTGDFCIMGWVYNAGTDHSVIHRGPIGTLSANGVFDIWTYETAGQIKAVFSSVLLILSAASNTNHFVAYVRTGGVLYGYVNGALAGSVANTNSMTLGTSDSLYIGKGYYSTVLAGGVADRLALWRISATAPSADQIAHIYRTELPLFQAGAQCTIAGTSTAVTALAYDDVADTLQVGTSWGRTSFRDLLRIDSEATSTGAITSLSANEGVVLTGGASSGKVYAPAMNLRDELRRKDVARKALGRVPAFFDYTATASQTAFVAPKGFTIKALYKNGTLMRETTTGVYWARSNDGFQETATLSVGATVSDWISLMCVRV